MDTMTAIGLPSLADEINAEHRACLSAASDALDHAFRCGDLLAQAKASCDHGDWQAWLADHFDGSGRTARMYMQIAGRRAEIAAKRQRHTVLNISEARRLIAEPIRKLSNSDDLFQPWLMQIIDEKLNGPFVEDDFEDADFDWLETKILHQVKAPPAIGFALLREFRDIALTRIIGTDELCDGIRILAEQKKCGFNCSGISLNSHSLIHLLTAAMIGTLLNELDRRKRLTDGQFDREREVIFGQFFAAVDRRVKDYSEKLEPVADE